MVGSRPIPGIARTAIPERTLRILAARFALPFGRGSYPARCPVVSVNRIDFLGLLSPGIPIRWGTCKGFAGFFYRPLLVTGWRR